MSFWIIPIVIFVGVTALALAVGMILRDQRASQELDERLDTFAGLKSSEAELPSLLREPIESTAVPAFSLSIGSPAAQLEKLIMQADLHFGTAPFVLVSVVLAVIGTIAAVLMRLPGLLTPVGAALGTLPLLYLLGRRRARLKKFGAQLPDAMELVARALRAGHSLAAGFQLVSQEMPPPISIEFQRTHDEQNFGVSLEDAMKNLGERVPNMDLQFFITAVSIQRQTGGDLAEILDKIGYVIRERFKIFGQVAALTAEGRLSGWILNGLPIMLLLALLKLNPGYVLLLFKDPMGRKMLVMAGFLQVLGAIAIHKIVNIRV